MCILKEKKDELSDKQKLKIKKAEQRKAKHFLNSFNCKKHNDFEQAKAYAIQKYNEFQISEDKTVASGWISGTASSYGAGGVAGGVGKPEGGSFHLRLSFLTENLQKYKKNFTTC